MKNSLFEEIKLYELLFLRKILIINKNTKFSSGTLDFIDLKNFKDIILNI